MIRIPTSFFLSLYLLDLMTEVDSKIKRYRYKVIDGKLVKCSQHSQKENLSLATDVTGNPLSRGMFTRNDPEGTRLDTLI